MLKRHAVVLRGQEAIKGRGCIRVPTCIAAAVAAAAAVGLHGSRQEGAERKGLERGA